MSTSIIRTEIIGEFFGLSEFANPKGRVIAQGSQDNHHGLIVA
ncbi:MAG: hypothetical protein AABN33_27610 [Acidobacteriota bacterium]